MDFSEKTQFPKDPPPFPNPKNRWFSNGKFRGFSNLAILVHEAILVRVWVFPKKNTLQNKHKNNLVRLFLFFLSCFFASFIEDSLKRFLVLRVGFKVGCGCSWSSRCEVLGELLHTALQDHVAGFRRSF